MSKLFLTRYNYSLFSDISQWLVVVRCVYMSEKQEIMQSALRMEKNDPDAEKMERKYKETAKKSSWLGKLLNRKRSPQGEVPTRDEVLSNLENNPDFIMPLELIDIIDDAKGTAKILADKELEALGVSDKIVEKAKPILELIAEESFLNYSQKEDEEGRSKAVKEASQAGIDHASELIKAITGQEESAENLASRVSLENLVDQVLPNLPMTETDKEKFKKEEYDLESIKEEIITLAGKTEWFDKSEELKQVLAVEEGLEASQAQALIIAVTGIHVSWEAIQGPRTTTEQKDLYDAMMEDRGKMKNNELVKKHSGIRIFKSANRTFPVMEKTMYLEVMKDENDKNKAVARAVFEVMKDLLQIVPFE